MNFKSSLWLGVFAACAAVNAATTVVTNDANQIVYTVDAGETNTVSVALPTNLAGLVKEGEGTLALSATNTFTYPVFVNAGYLQPTADKAIGGGVVTIADGAAVNVAMTGLNQNISYNTTCPNIKVAGSGPDGQGALRLNGGGSGDKLFPLVTLTGDAMFGGVTRWGVSKCDLGGHTLTILTPGNYEMFNANTFLNPGHIRAHKVTFQGGVTLNGGSANTFTMYKSGGELRYWSSSKAPTWTLKVDENTTVMAGGGSGRTNRNNNRWSGPVQIAAGKRMTVSYYDSTDNAVQFNGVISGEGELYKTGGNNLYLDAGSDSTPNTYTGGTRVDGGTLVLNRPGALACYDQVGKFNVTGSPTISFYCPPDRWTPETIRTAVNTSTNFSPTALISHNVSSSYPPVTYTEGFNKVVEIGIEGGGELCWKTSFKDDTTRLYVNNGTMTLDYPTTFYCPWGAVGYGTLKLQGGVCLDQRNAADFTVGGGSAWAKLIVSNATLKAEYTSSGATRELKVGSTAAAGAIVEVLERGVISNRIQVASGTKQRGAVYQRGGLVRHYARGGNDGWCGSGTSSYGFYDLTGGTLHIGGWFGFGHNSSAGVLQMTNGTIKVGELPIGRGGYGRMYMSGGTVQSTSQIVIGEQQWGQGENLGNAVITVDGENALMKTTSEIRICQRTNNYQSVLNINRGVVAAPVIYEPDYQKAQRSASARSLLNFNGGTYRAMSDRSEFLGGSGYRLDRVTIYEKGATIDTSSFTLLDLGVPITGASGKGVTSITYTGTRTGYIGSPEVHVSGGGGEGATAFIPFDSKTGTIGDVIITSRGNDYTSAPTIWFWNAARTAAITCTVEIAENVSGGLTVVGPGELKLGAKNTYTGDTVVSNGAAFTIMCPETLPVGNTVKLSALGGDTRFAVWTNDVTLAGFGGSGRLVKTSTDDAHPGSVRVTDKLHFDGAELAAGKTLAATGLGFSLGENVSIEIANTNLLELSGRAYPLITVSAGSEFSYTPALANLEQPWKVIRTDDNKTLKLLYSVGTVMILR